MRETVTIKVKMSYFFFTTEHELFLYRVRNKIIQRARRKTGLMLQIPHVSMILYEAITTEKLKIDISLSNTSKKDN